MKKGKASFKHVKVNWTFNLDEITAEVRQAVEIGLNDCVDDLIRVSSECAPHDEGILEKSWGRNVRWEGKNRIVGTVDYSVSEEESGKAFNYALWTHEEDYNLGEKSKQKPGGVGMSGQTYEVGKGYLTRPLYGEESTYKQHIQNMVDKAVK